MSKILIARPRLDCSFKQGVVPETMGPPLNCVLALFGRFIDQLQTWHESRGDRVDVDLRPLWRFELADLQQQNDVYDAIYFPHRIATQYPIGASAIYYKNAPLNGYYTLDRSGWGASMSWAPVHPIVTEAAWRAFASLKQRVVANESLIAQPNADVDIPHSDYILFVCQLPPDDTIRYHSTVTVEQALSAVVAYAQASGRTLVVKGHPANPASMAPLKRIVADRPDSFWVDDVSIHACLRGAKSVFMVNSGVGFEAMLHEKPIFRFGSAEYDLVIPKVEPSVDNLIAAERLAPRLEDYVGFLSEYLSRCVRLDEPRSFDRALGRGFASRAERVTE